MELEGMDEKDQAIQLYSVFKKTLENLIEEYDLTDVQIGQVILQVLDEFIEVEIEFEPDFDLEEEDDLEE